MNEKTAVMSRKGQVTIPSEFRRALGLRMGDRVMISMEEDEVRIRRAGSAVARTAGMLKGDEPAKSAEEFRNIAEIMIAEDVTRRGLS